VVVVYILIPPSEGKIVPNDARPVATGSLVLPQLADLRGRVVEALSRLSAGPREQALAALGLTPGQASELDHNRLLASAPAQAAAQVYRGVLFDALDLPGLEREHADAYGRAQERVLVFSALWGVLRPQDRIPHYRCSTGVKLPGVGSVTTAWRRELAEPLGALVGDHLVVDLRSTAYMGMWKGTANTVSVRVLHEREVGGVVKRTVVSHFNKATKGRVVRALLMSGERPGNAPELAESLRGLGFAIETAAIPRQRGAKGGTGSMCGTSGGPAVLDLVVSEL
jgi:hypothetical protein